LAVVLLLPVYAAALLMASGALRANIVSSTRAETVRPVFVPILWDCDSNLPGAIAVIVLYWTINLPFVGGSEVLGTASPLNPPILPTWPYS